jgi:hypothetical protein
LNSPGIDDNVAPPVVQTLTFPWFEELISTDNKCPQEIDRACAEASLEVVTLLVVAQFPESAATLKFASRVTAGPRREEKSGAKLSRMGAALRIIQ